MINQNKQSKAAKAAGVCHTERECGQMYRELTPEIKAPALDMLRKELAPCTADIEAAFKRNPDGWYVKSHFHWGMAVRNLLRDKKFGEKYFKVHNLDDIYVALVEEALGLRPA